jgi:hypothetical protein
MCLICSCQSIASQAAEKGRLVLNLTILVDWCLPSEHRKGRRAERRQVLVFASGGDWQQVAHPHQVVGSGSEGEGPTETSDSTMPGLAQSGDRLEPAEDLFRPFAFDLTLSTSGGWKSGFRISTRNSAN